MIYKNEKNFALLRSRFLFLMEGLLITLLTVFFNWFRDENFSKRDSIGVVCLGLIFCYTVISLVVLCIDLSKNCMANKAKKITHKSNPESTSGSPILRVSSSRISRMSTRFSHRFRLNLERALQFRR